MKYIDAHVHVGDADLVKKYVSTSPLRNKIRLYSALDDNVVRMQDAYLKECEMFVGLPIILKEIDVKTANDYLEVFAKNHSNCIPAFLVGDDITRYQRNFSRVLKEHFLHHTEENFDERKSSYEYLNSIEEGYLLIHSADINRLEYIQSLLKNYSHMNIIIAHLGRNVYESFEFSKRIIDTFSHENRVLFDISTIKNGDMIRYAVEALGDKRLFMGSDFPYECKINWNVEQFFQPLLNANLSNESLQRILYDNAKNLLIKE